MSTTSDLLSFENLPSENKSSNNNNPFNDFHDESDGHSGGLKVKCANCNTLMPLDAIEAHSRTCNGPSSSNAFSSSGNTNLKSNDSKALQPTSSAATVSATAISTASSDSKPNLTTNKADKNAPRQIVDETSSLGLNLSTPSKQSSNVIGGILGAVSDMVSGDKEKGPPENPMPDVSLNNPALLRDYTRTTRIAFVIDEPREGGGRFSSYVSYRVNWRTELKQFGGLRCYYVRRKYIDFEFLHRHLTRLYPYCVIPPLASPQGFMQKEFDIPFRERRMRLLQRYLNRIGNHPILAESELLVTFLTIAKKDAWTKAMADLDEEERREKAGPGRNSKQFSGEAPPMSPADDEANQAAKEMRTELQLLIAGFRELHKQLELSVTERTNHHSQTVLVTAAIQKFSQLDGLRRPVCNIDTSPMVNALTAFTGTFAMVDDIDNLSINVESESMWEMVRDWTYYLRAADEYLTRFFTLRSFCAFSLSAWQARAKLVANPPTGSATVGTDEVVDPYLKQLEETKNYDQGKYEQILKSFEKETVRWEVYKQREIIHWSNYYAKLQIDLLQKAVQAWEGFLAKNLYRGSK